jgi:hypothetical protein
MVNEILTLPISSRSPVMLLRTRAKCVGGGAGGTHDDTGERISRRQRMTPGQGAARRCAAPTLIAAGHAGVGAGGVGRSLQPLKSQDYFGWVRFRKTGLATARSVVGFVLTKIALAPRTPRIRFVLPIRRSALCGAGVRAARRREPAPGARPSRALCAMTRFRQPESGPACRRAASPLAPRPSATTAT